MTILKTFTLTSYRVNDMIIDDDLNVMAFSGDSIMSIDAGTLAMKWRKFFTTIEASLISNRRSLSSVSFDFSKNLMYGVANAPQPSTAPHVIYTYDLNLETFKLISNNFVGASTINFEPKSQTIVTGYSKTVSLLDTKGVVKAAFSTPYTITEILLKP